MAAHTSCGAGGIETAGRILWLALRVVYYGFIVFLIIGLAICGKPSFPLNLLFGGERDGR